MDSEGRWLPSDYIAQLYIIGSSNPTWIQSSVTATFHILVMQMMSWWCQWWYPRQHEQPAVKTLVAKGLKPSTVDEIPHAVPSPTNCFPDKVSFLFYIIIIFFASWKVSMYPVLIVYANGNLCISVKTNSIKVYVPCSNLLTHATLHMRLPW